MNQRVSMIDVTDNPEGAINDIVMSKNMAELLHRKYPGHAWAVTCNGEQGIATIRDLKLSAQWGYVLKLKDLNHDHDGKLVMRAAGEILERFRVARGVANEEKIMELPQLVIGLPQFDHEAAKSRVPDYIIKAVDRTRRLRV